MSAARDAIETGVRAWNAGHIDGLMVHHADDASLWFRACQLSSN